MTMPCCTSAIKRSAVRTSLPCASDDGAAVKLATASNICSAASLSPLSSSSRADDKSQPGEHGGAGGTVAGGEGGGDDGRACGGNTRTPQSWQSVPKSQLLDMLPSPPSSHSPSFLYRHGAKHCGGHGNWGGGGDGGGDRGGGMR
eukprot:4209099-Pleurochrysis_carterae.AAC.1